MLLDGIVRNQLFSWISPKITDSGLINDQFPARNRKVTGCRIPESVPSEKINTKWHHFLTGFSGSRERARLRRNSLGTKEFLARTDRIRPDSMGLSSNPSGKAIITILHLTFDIIGL